MLNKLHFPPHSSESISSLVQAIPQQGRALQLLENGTCALAEKAAGLPAPQLLAPDGPAETQDS